MSPNCTRGLITLCEYESSRVRFWLIQILTIATNSLCHIYKGRRFTMKFWGCTQRTWLKPCLWWFLVRIWMLWSYICISYMRMYVKHHNLCTQLFDRETFKRFFFNKHPSAEHHTNNLYTFSKIEVWSFFLLCVNGEKCMCIRYICSQCFH